MFTILDRYIIRKFLGTYIFSLALILAITVMFDINEKMDAFQKASWHEILFDYFANFIPYFANQFSPLFVFISVIFFTSKLAGHSEIIAMVSSGLSYRRMLVPYLFCAAVIAAATWYVGAYVIPPGNAKRIEFTNKYVKDQRVSVIANVQMKIAPDQVIFFGDFNATNNRGSRFSLDTFEGQRLKSRLTAGTATWRGGYSWRLRNFNERRFLADREDVRSGAELDTVIVLTPTDIIISQQDQEKMTTPELRAYIVRQQERGAGNISRYEVEYHRRYASCAAAFILTIIGVSLSSRKIKGGMGINIGLGLVLSFAYILFMGVTQSFAVSGMTTPFVAMWIPNFVFSIIALILLARLFRR